MKLQEGQIYEGRISLSGAQGPVRHWLVVAPFGRIHIHSIDSPLDTHCWPASALLEGLATERARLVGYASHHPMIRLQRAKEAWGIRDTALGLPRHRLEKMLALLRRSLAEDREMALYAAGEIIEYLQRTPLLEAHAKAIERYLGRMLKQTGDVFEALTQWVDQPARLQTAGTRPVPVSVRSE